MTFYLSYLGSKSEHKKKLREYKSHAMAHMNMLWEYSCSTFSPLFFIPFKHKVNAS